MGKKPKPPLFEVFPTLEAEVNEFIMNHLDCFTVEMLRGELTTKMIPKLVEEVEKDGEKDTVAYHLLENYTENPTKLTNHDIFTLVPPRIHRLWRGLGSGGRAIYPRKHL